MRVNSVDIYHLLWRKFCNKCFNTVHGNKLWSICYWQWL